MDIQAWQTQYKALYTPHIEAGHYPADVQLALSWRDQWNGTRFTLTDTDAVEKQLDQLDNRKIDSYFRVTPMVNRAYGRNERGGAQDGLGLQVIFADIDTLDGVHEAFKGTQAGLPHPTHQQALDLVTAIGTPTLVIASGGGLQAYWRLAEPLRIPLISSGEGEGKPDRTSLEQMLILRFNEHLITLAHDAGFSVDIGVTGDAAMALRTAVPATGNEPNQQMFRSLKSTRVLNTQPRS